MTKRDASDRAADDRATDDRATDAGNHGSAPEDPTKEDSATEHTPEGSGSAPESSGARGIEPDEITVAFGQSFSLATGGGLLPIAPSADASTEPPPDQLGTYKIVDRLGEGTVKPKSKLRRASSSNKESPELVQTLNWIGRHSQNWGQYDRAEIVHQRAATIARASTGLNQRELALALGGLAGVAWRRREYQSCIAQYREANKVFAHVVDDEHSDIAWNTMSIANCQFDLERFDAAVASFLAAHETFVRVYGPDHPRTAFPLQNLGIVYRDLGRHDEAEAIFRETLRIFETADGPDHSNVAYVCNGLGSVFEARGAFAEAERWYRRGLEIREERLTPDAQPTQDILKRLIEAVRAQGREDDARVLEARITTTEAVDGSAGGVSTDG